MNYRYRLISGRLKKMVEHFPVVVVCGARQVGKSTLLQHVFPQWDCVVFDPAIDVGNARQDPDLFLDNHPSPVILDEIQYAPELVAAIKRRVDRTGEAGQFLLTGSQQWSVLRTASESLAGRAVFLDLEGFSLAEAAGETLEEHWLARYLEAPDDFGDRSVGEPGRLISTGTLFETLWRGFLPNAQELDWDLLGEFYRAYLRTYIERDVRLLGDVADWQQFGRFTRLTAALTAQEVNHSQFGREIGVTPQTAQRWLAMLRGTYQWFEIPAYHGNTIKRVSGKPKGFLGDTGLACSLQMISSPKALSGHPLVGSLFETAVVGELRKLSSTLATPPVFYHWRSHGGAEIDALLERDGRFFPIEVKMTTKPGRNDTSGITAFRKTYPGLNVAPGLVICPVAKPFSLNSLDLAFPWNTR
ncbi:MAG: DUF4143 domain-containing protein [Thermoanaerobaculales bacterium]|nr:DUF4143 domain-containing protein [Thermoanaerobaculales bacterium]